jgi:hypothetical protein
MAADAVRPGDDRVCLEVSQLLRVGIAHRSLTVGNATLQVRDFCPSTIFARETAFFEVCHVKPSKSFPPSDVRRAADQDRVMIPQAARVRRARSAVFHRKHNAT